VPVLILGVSIAEPLVTRCAVYGRRVGAGPISRRDALAQPLQVRALVLLSHGHGIPRAAILRAARTAAHRNLLIRLDHFQADFSLLLGTSFADPDHAASLGVGHVFVENKFDHLAAPKIKTSS
jgi:hypothetical protein